MLSLALVGTKIADGPHVAPRDAVLVDSVIYLALLGGLLTWWRRSEGTLSVHSITTARRKRFYWGRPVAFGALVAYLAVTHTDTDTDTTA
ncbi:MAG: hypothetical protein JWN84_1444 [Nocardioides sp.]|nr:hypothetical protein [Nocardioides sp.]